MGYADEVLGRDEQALHVARQHIIVLFSKLVGELTLIAVLIMAGVVSLRAFDNQQANGIMFGQIVLLICAVISLGILLSILLDYLRWSTTQYLVTDRRVIQLDGVFTKTMRDSSLEKINDIVMQQSWLGQMLDFGDVEILTGNEGGANRMDRMAQPLAFKQALMEAKHHYDHGFGYLDPSPVTPYTQGGEIETVLTELATLRDRGILSSDEFEAKKRELLSRI